MLIFQANISRVTMKTHKEMSDELSDVSECINSSFMAAAASQI